MRIVIMLIVTVVQLFARWRFGSQAVSGVLVDFFAASSLANAAYWTLRGTVLVNDRIIAKEVMQ